MSVDEECGGKCLFYSNWGRDELSKGEFELAQADVGMDISDGVDDDGDGRLGGDGDSDGCGDMCTLSCCSPPASESL